MDRQKRPRLYLIKPRVKYKHYAAQQELSHLMGKKRMTIPVQLPLLAALTPPHYDVKIIDDETDPLILDPRPDLVGITCVGATVDRAFEIADTYRNLGVTVVMGGVYPSFRPDHVLEHCDHVIIGEAEGVWQELLADLERGRARQSYRNEVLPAFKRSPLPRWDLIDIDRTMTVSVETSRGCPFNCDFCVVNKMFGHKMRFREIDDVIAEIEAAPIKRLFFVADNFAIRKSYARELVRRLKPLGTTWICQSSIHVAKDLDFLQEMAEAGCSAILIGFESLNQAALKGVKKYHNHIEDFERAIERVHSVGIHVLGSFIVGFDEDRPETFSVIEDFIERNDLVFTMMNIMSIAPGTALYDQMEAAGRVNVVESSYRNGIFPCMRYMHFSQREIFDIFFEVTPRLFTWEGLSRRALRLFGTGNFAKPGPEQVSTREKIATLALLSRRFLLTRDRAKRQLFLSLLTMVREGRLAPDKMVLFLLNMEAFNNFFLKAEGYLDQVRAQIDKVDLGPWSQVCEASEPTLTPAMGCLEQEEGGDDRGAARSVG